MKVRYLMVPITALVGVAALASCGGAQSALPCEVYVVVGDSVLAHDSAQAGGTCRAVVRLEAQDSAGGDPTPTYTILSADVDSAGGDSTPGS